ncbi:hypothetical protein KI387_006228, partial [Taxus chinensis]
GSRCNLTVRYPSGISGSRQIYFTPTPISQEIESSPRSFHLVTAFDKDYRLEDHQIRLKMVDVFSGDETAPFFGFLGAAAALVFSCMGAAYGTAKSGVGVASMGVMRPELVMKSIVPVVMAGVLGIYGLIIAVIISTGINPKAKSYYLFDGYAHLSSGLACGLSGLSAGMAIGIVGDAGVRANAQQPKLFVGMILILIFAEALALYGLIVGIILSSRA